MMDKIKLVRVEYGKKDTLKHMREYIIFNHPSGNAGVGTLQEFKNAFKKGTEFEIIDPING